MILDIAVTTDAASWMNPFIAKMAEDWRSFGHRVTVGNAPGYSRVDIAFFLSFSRLVSRDVLDRARSNIVVHGSALPEGRGWSPWTWQIIEGKNRLPLTLFEADVSMDSGDIYDQRWVELEGHELIEEWQAIQARVTTAMCTDFILEFPGVLARRRVQSGEASEYRRRRPADSRLDPALSLSKQFDLLRTVDNERYPAYFELNGHTYTLSIAKRKSDHQ